VRTSILRQGYGKPSQGLQLRGCNHLTEGLIAFVPLNTGEAHEGRAGPGIANKTMDIGPYPFSTQWQPGGQTGAGGVPLPVSSPWGLSERFGQSNDEYLIYPASTLYATVFPTGAQPRTMSALIRRYTSESVLDEVVFNYGQDAFHTTNGAFFCLLYNFGNLRFYDNTTYVNASFVPDSHWHLVSLVFPVGGTVNTDILFYIDGMLAPPTSNTGTTTINTITEAARNDRTYAIGQYNGAYASGTAFDHAFHGLIAGAWVWNRALSAAEQNSHWQDPFQMIARPRSYVTFIEVLAPPPPNPPPTCSIFSSPGTINPGDTSTLTWTTANTPDTADIDNGIGSVNPLGGTVDVTPTTTTTYVLTVENVDGTSTCEATVIVQAIPGELEGQCNNPPSGRVGVDYTHTFIATGGVPAYTYTIIAGILPIGLTLASNGVVSGIPLLRGMYFFTVQATDSNGLISTFSCNIPIAC